ncbi:hypothetical protein IQ241_14125 [Romeria aff. gracilis LEGE 07310]|uniref:Uncharacterized protein n=1 Tax=Vasconcelosia minhoensis LEGE 07310 TaxID=915328 RepID=A0A8J7AGG1_9CYAN|nr:hypothetical protein [Romeria gracilis]MBE9078419.1 hypothetical protein [Romeria aff. gracilis LEGE 07310]
MSTVNHDAIVENIKRLTDTVDIFVNKCNDLEGRISELQTQLSMESERLTDVIGSAVGSAVVDLREEYTLLREEVNSAISQLEEGQSKTDAKLYEIKERFEKVYERTIGLNERIDGFTAQIDFLRDNIKALATKQHVDDSIGKAIAEQSRLLTSELASNKLLEKLEKRLAGDDGQGGLTGVIREVKSSLETDLNMLMDKLNSKRDFIVNVSVTGLIALLGAGGITTWLIDRSISPIDAKVEQIEAQSLQISEDVEEIKSVILDR